MLSNVWMGRQEEAGETATALDPLTVVYADPMNHLIEVY